MDHPEGAGLQRADRVDFDPCVRLEFCGTQLSSGGRLLVMRELDDALGLSRLASAALFDTRRGKNTVHRLDGLFRQSVFGRLADAAWHLVEYAELLGCEPCQLIQRAAESMSTQKSAVQAFIWFHLHVT